MEESKLQIYTDGSCNPNPGPGGWGAVFLFKGKKSEICGGQLDTTNNRMELTAVIEALRHLNERRSVEVFTDSQYVQLGISQWIHSWKKSNWKRGKAGSVKNVDLWKELDRLNQFHDVKWHWVKAHSGTPWNEYVDQLAKSATPAH